MTVVEKGRSTPATDIATKYCIQLIATSLSKGAMCTATCLQNEPGYSARKRERGSARKLTLKLFTDWSWACSWTLSRYRFELCCLRFDETCCLIFQCLSEQIGQVFGPLFLRNLSNSFHSHNDSVSESKLYQIKMIYRINLSMNQIYWIKLYPHSDSANRNFWRYASKVSFFVTWQCILFGWTPPFCRDMKGWVEHD